MEPINLTYKEAFIYIAIINTAIGFVFGLIPFFIGYLKSKMRYGVIGFIASIFCGAILGIYLAVPVSAIFSWMILESKLVRTVIGVAIAVTGILTSVFGFVRMNSASSQILQNFDGKDPVALTLLFGGLIYTIVGIILVILSLWTKPSPELIENAPVD